jgi:hypothetical protein
MITATNGSWLCSLTLRRPKLAFSVKVRVDRRPARVKIVVLVKHVPCVLGGLPFAPDLTVDRSGRRGELNEADEYAVDQALRIAVRPYCIVMLTDGVAALKQQGKAADGVRVTDVSEVLLQSVRRT